MAIRVGLEAKLYRNTGVLGAATPTMVAVNNCRDLTLGLEKNEADVTTRGNNGWRALIGVLKEATIEFSMIADGEDPDYVEFRDTFLAASAPETQVDVVVYSADKALPDAEGLRAVCIVLNFTRNEPLEEALTVDVTLRPTYFPSLAPGWVEGPTFTPVVPALMARESTGERAGTRAARAEEPPGAGAGAR